MMPFGFGKDREDEDDLIREASGGKRKMPRRKKKDEIEMISEEDDYEEIEEPPKAQAIEEIDELPTELPKPKPKIVGRSLELKFSTGLWERIDEASEVAGVDAEVFVKYAIGKALKEVEK